MNARPDIPDNQPAPSHRFRLAQMGAITSTIVFEPFLQVDKMG
jgi:hypothetical protein